MLAARLTAVVVFPTPPFWFEIATTLLIDLGAGGVAPLYQAPPGDSILLFFGPW